MCGNMARSLKVLPVCLHVCVAHFCAKTGLAERRLRFAPPTFHALGHCRELHWFQLRHVRLPEIQAICNQLGWKMRVNWTLRSIGSAAEQGSGFSIQLPAWVLHSCALTFLLNGWAARLVWVERTVSSELNLWCLYSCAKSPCLGFYSNQLLYSMQLLYQCSKMSFWEDRCEESCNFSWVQLNIWANMRFWKVLS